LFSQGQHRESRDLARSDLPIVREGEIAEKTVGRTPERSGRAWTLRGREKEKVLVERPCSQRGRLASSGIRARLWSSLCSGNREKQT
jgi:hypothetical protein